MIPTTDFDCLTYTHRIPARDPVTIRNFPLYSTKSKLKVRFVSLICFDDVGTFKAEGELIEGQIIYDFLWDEWGPGPCE